MTAGVLFASLVAPTLEARITPYQEGRWIAEVIEKIKREPIVSRVGLSAILSVLVAAGVIDTGASEAVEAAVIAVVNAVTILTARKRVTADPDLVYEATVRRRRNQ